MFSSQAYRHEILSDLGSSTMQSLSVQVAVRLEAYHRVGSSTVPARVGIRRHIGTESYHRVVFHRHIGAELLSIYSGGFSGSSTMPATGSGGFSGRVGVLGSKLYLVVFGS